MATNAEIARDLTLAVIDAVGVIDTGGERQETNRNRAREVGTMFGIIYAAIADTRKSEGEEPWAAGGTG